MSAKKGSNKRQSSGEGSPSKKVNSGAEPGRNNEEFSSFVAGQIEYLYIQYYCGQGDVMLVKAYISTNAKPHVVAKLKSLHQDHIRVLKHKNRRSDTQEGLESDSTLRMGKLFDIAHAD